MIIAPSVLSLDFSKFSEQVNILNNNCKWLHFDVMDGHFVDNLSFGPQILKNFRKKSDLYLDVHIMVDDPFKFSDMFIRNGADGITFHYEALNGDIDKCLDLIRQLKENYITAGISIKPNTAIEDIIPLLDVVDLVLIMSVEPGFGGQQFIDETYKKVAFLDTYRKNNNLNFMIEVDGGVNDKNAYELKKKGTDVIVAGSYIFNGDIKYNIDKLKNSTK